MTTKTHPLARSVVQRLQLGELATELERAPKVGTLYVPPLGERPVEDDDLLEVMRDARAPTARPHSAG